LAVDVASKIAAVGGVVDDDEKLGFVNCQDRSSIENLYVPALSW